MNDGELADAVVALGVGRIDLTPHFGTTAWSDGTPRYVAPNCTGWHGAYGFVRDWRVAGAVMENCPNGVRTCFDNRWCAQVWPITDDDIEADFGPVCMADSLPRAIIEAGVLALTEHNTTDKE